MRIISLPYFGRINLDELDGYYNIKINFGRDGLNLDLSFQNKNVSSELQTNIIWFLENINSFNDRNKKLIQEDFEQGKETLDYLKFYLEELPEDELGEIIELDSNISYHLQLLKKLKLNRLGLYPDGKYGTENFAVFDYSIDIDNKPCNQLLVVYSDNKGGLNNITWES